MTCRGITQYGDRCRRKVSDNTYCYLHSYSAGRECSLKDVFAEASRQAKEGNIYYPWASSFLEWILPLLRKHKIPYRNPNTGGDYSRTFVGKAPGVTSIMMDWKHFDTYHIDEFNAALKPYGFKILSKEIERGYKVRLKEI